jgi:serine/threonine protein kinase
MDQRSEQARSQLFTVKLDKNAVYMLAEQDQALHSAQQRPQPSSALQSRQAPPARRNLSVSQVIDGKYRILEPIGQGGMGAVFRVFHIQLDKEVALKTFVTDALTEEAWLRFQREAQAIARLNHLNVVKVFDFGVDSDGVPYYTMELLRGRSLAQVIDEEGGFDQKRTISTFIMVARGLAAAHSRGIIHRDIKPGNILLMEDNSGRYEESVKLVDFGIATLVSDSDNAAPQGESGVIFGSPLYMSPEQFRGDKLTPGTDLYSFGCTLFEALTTKPPFFGANAIETMSMHLNAAPPTLDSALPAMDVPQRLERLLGSLLAKDVQDRPADFSIVERELLAVLERLEATAALASKASIKRLATSAPIDDDDEIEARADLLPQSFWKRSVISTIALVSLLVLGIAGGAVVLQKPIKAVLAGTESPLPTGNIPEGSPGASGQPLPDGAPVPKSSRISSAIEKGTFDQADLTFVGAFEKAAKTVPDLDPKVLAAIKPGSFDVTSEEEREHKIKHFVFPKGVNLGKFKLGLASGPENEAQATGDVVLFRHTWFYPGKQFAKYPELLDGFKNDSITAITADQNCLLTDKHMAKIVHWKELGGFDIDARRLTPAGLSGINRLTKLSAFGLPYMSLTADQIGRIYDLHKMKVLDLSGLTNVRTLLTELGPGLKLKELYVQDCALTDEDLKYISGYSDLERLSVRDNPKVTDVGVKYLSKAKLLKSLELSGTSVSPAVSEIFEEFPSLSRAVVNTRVWNEQQRQQFASKLPTRIGQFDQ